MEHKINEECRHGRDPPWYNCVIDAIRAVWHGKVVVVVQKGKVVRIDKTEQTLVKD